MGKALTVAVIVIASFGIFGGLAGLLLARALAVPIGIVIGLIALVLGWFDR